jgi:hypothetical protein
MSRRLQIFLPNYSKDFLVAFVTFQGVTRRKKLFMRVGVSSKIFAPRRLAARNHPKNGSLIFARSENEAETKRIRFAREILRTAKSLISLRRDMVQFRGFQ